MDINKIDRGSIINMYEGIHKETAVKPEAKDAAVVKADRIGISEGVKSADAKDIAVTRIKADISREVSGERIARLRALINSGGYVVTAKEIAAAMLSGRRGE